MTENSKQLAIFAVVYETLLQNTDCGAVTWRGCRGGGGTCCGANQAHQAGHIPLQQLGCALAKPRLMS